VVHEPDGAAVEADKPCGFRRNGPATFPSGQYDLLVSQLPDYGLVGTCSLFLADEPISTDHEARQLAAQSAADGLFAAEEPPPARPSRRQLLGGETRRMLQRSERIASEVTTPESEFERRRRSASLS